MACGKDPATSEAWWKLRMGINSLLSRGFAQFHGVSLPATSFFLAVTVSSTYRPSVSISLRPHLRELVGAPCHHMRKNIF